MALIPNTQKFHTVAGVVDTENKGSAQLNAQRQAFTMADIIDTAFSGAATVFVKAEGTPEENGVALLAGYNEAVSKIPTTTTLPLIQNFNYQTIFYPTGTLPGATEPVWKALGDGSSDFPITPSVGDTWTGKMAYSESGQTINKTVTVVVQGSPALPTSSEYYYKMFDTDGNELFGTSPTDPSPFETNDFGAVNPLILATEYDSINPLEQPVTLVIEPGYYLITSDFSIDALVNVTSATGQPDVYITGGDIKIKSGANNDDYPILINGLNTTSNAFEFGSGDAGVGTQNSSIYVEGNLDFITVMNCVSKGWWSFGVDPSETGTITSTFINCEGGEFSFGSGTHNTIGSAKFINCKSEQKSFGYKSTIQETAKFEQCSGEGNELFGYESPSCKGTFIECTANGDGAFGADAVLVEGRFINCTAEQNSFGYNSTNDGSEYFGCIGSRLSFSNNGPAVSGTTKYIDCQCVTSPSGAPGVGFNSTSGTRLMINCHAASIGPIYSGSVAYNCSESSWSINGTGKVLNCLNTSTNTVVNL